MELRRVNVVYYWVSDVDRALTFYRDALGLTPGSRYGEWQEFEIGGTCRFAIHSGADGHVSRQTAVASLEIDDLDAAIVDLARAGHDPIDEITDTGVTRFVTYVDPDGNHIQLIAPTDRRD